MAYPDLALQFPVVAMLEAGITTKSSQNTVAAFISLKGFSLPPNPSDGLWVHQL